MEPGNIVEYIDRQRITCAVILDIKKMRLRLLTEANREVNLSASRLSHKGDVRLDLSMGRDKLVSALKETASKRKSLISHINIQELWEVLYTEQEWIDLSTMTQFCFPNNPTFDHESAVVRAFFDDKQYFKFNPDKFFPNTEEQVEKIIAQTKEAERKNKIIEAGSAWLKSVTENNHQTPTSGEVEITDILSSYYLLEKESPHHNLAKAILERTGYRSSSIIFKALVKAGYWDINENLDLKRYDIPVTFPEPVMASANEKSEFFSALSIQEDRKDLTHLPLMTIDGQSTLDFDDALSIQYENGHYLIGIHIADVGYFIKRGEPVDLEATTRASSIYLPDLKIPMIPPDLAEGICSLKAGKNRPAISIMTRINPSGQILDYEIIPSVINVKHQLTYYDVNQVADENKNIQALYDVAKKFQQQRLDQGAIQITLPEINTWIDESGNLNLAKTNRESPGRLLVAELMIMANWLMAKFLAKNGLSAIYRSQTEPRDRLYQDNNGTLFQNWMQRKLLSRFMLTPEPEPHSGLGLDVYVTASSPIRKYFDLVTQRQIRAALGLEPPYTQDEIRHIIQILEQPMGSVFRLQYQRHRYWLLKYLEGKVGDREEAIIIAKRKSSHIILLTNYMIECTLPVSAGIDLKPEDLVQVTIQHVDARNDVLTVFLT